MSASEELRAAADRLDALPTDAPDMATGIVDLLRFEAVQAEIDEHRAAVASDAVQANIEPSHGPTTTRALAVARAILGSAS